MTNMISYERIKEIEKDLQRWCKELPTAWRPRLDGTTQTFRCVLHAVRFGNLGKLYHHEVK